MRKEVSGLFNFFQENVGEVVDMNLDYFPDMIIVSFVNHKDVVTALEKKDPLVYKVSTSLLDAR